METIINFLSTPFFEEYNKWLGLAGVLAAVICEFRKAFNLVYWIEISTLTCLMIGFVVFIFKQFT